MDTPTLNPEQSIEAYIESLDTMVAYQPHSIVSKLIANKKSGTVTMFAFDEGQGISEQALPYDSVLFVTDGELEIFIAEEDPKIVSEGEIVYIPAHTSHMLNGHTAFKMFSIMIRS